MAYKRKPFKHQMHITRREDFPTMSEATVFAGTVGTLFYERGFYGVVWFEGSTRRVRHLSKW